MDARIELRGLGKSYGSKAALRDIALRVEPGELLGLIGPNGAGKSTLLRILVGLVGRDQGEVSVLGLDPARQSLPIRRRCCYLPGETSVYQTMTGRQFLDFALGFHRRHDRELLAHLQTRFELPLRQRVRGYSAGMKQKLALMASLVPDVELYLLDEPDRALDASVRFQLREVLRELRARGKTIVLSSHHLAEVESLADRLEFVVQGQNVPTARVAAARARLQRRLRLRLIDGAEPPAGARTLGREPDGTLALEVDGHPLDWLRSVPPAQVVAAEIGAVRLEDLYQALTTAEAAS